MTHEPLATAVREAGARVLARYATASRPPGLPEVLADLRANDAAVAEV
ncbi:3'(2'),5'-bisphosphate nucleotidase CysQ, partial [Amycolatopsis sp. SID8362]|nr:3'(2'),5'-bisphosphate nucleotidase CysQ [Amycolatopsis sp. SID8362]NED49032.1 3'(2'),5'-bisphosphate nucleotidase CysQ [Amycolatopsis sp. SID8362]